eukprot:2924643-Pleurochrysis_carterae.AAC.5
MQLQEGGDQQLLGGHKMGSKRIRCLGDEQHRRRTAVTVALRLVTSRSGRKRCVAHQVAAQRRRRSSPASSPQKLAGRLPASIYCVHVATPSPPPLSLSVLALHLVGFTGMLPPPATVTALLLYYLASFSVAAEAPVVYVGASSFFPSLICFADSSAMLASAPLLCHKRHSFVGICCRDHRQYFNRYAPLPLPIPPPPDAGWMLSCCRCFPPAVTSA